MRHYDAGVVRDFRLWRRRRIQGEIFLCLRSRQNRNNGFRRRAVALDGRIRDAFGAEKLGEIISAGDVREAAYNFDLLTRQVCYDCHIFLWTVLIYMTLSVKGKTFDALFETAYVLLYT